jgi:hypothetical protein
MLTLTLTISFLTLGSAQWQPLFNGTDLEGWTIVNGAPSTWTVKDEMIVCSGKPTGVMRTNNMYENFILELDWRHVVPNGNAGLFVWSDPIPAVGVPFTRAIEVQIMDGKELDWYTTHGDIFSIWGASMVPDVPHPMGDHIKRCLPSERRSKAAPQWNHYTVTCIDGQINLSVNGAFVSGGYNVTPNKGYICLEAEGTEAEFKNIKIMELPPSSPATTEVANEDEGFKTLYTGIDLSGWEGDPDHWTVGGWSLLYDGSGNDLTTSATFGKFEIMIDAKCDNPEGEIYLMIDGEKRMIPINAGNWSRFISQGEGGTIRLGGSSKAEFCNIFIRPLT